MCGIICYTGRRPALPILLDGLKRLEYRGYDSSGLALQQKGEVFCRRAVGKIRVLEESLNGSTLEAPCGIAHTRWATHGRPTEANAHPHCDCAGRIFVVHNGIVENFRELKEELASRGHAFRSETDTEVLSHLIEEAFDGDLERAVATALSRVQGTVGMGVLSAVLPGQVVAARRGSPLILGIGGQETFASSDVAALVSHTRQVVYLEDEDLAVLEPGRHRITNVRTGFRGRPTSTVDWDVGSAEKQGFPHFMLKEIHEQPEAIENAVRGRLLESDGISKLGGLESVNDRLTRMRRLIIVSCGTSYFAGMLGRCLFESYTDVGVEVDLASEFRYRRLNLRPGTVVLAISQSGETADTLAAVREAKRKGALVLGLVNVVGSNIARETHAGVYNHAGPEIGVASTKSYISQLALLYLMTLLLARHQQMAVGEGQAFLRELKATPSRIRRILDGSAHIRDLAAKYAYYRNFFFLGRRFNYPVAMEGALKLKEISYLHAEGYAAGEMKHGPIALIDESFPAVCLAPRDSTYEKMVSNIEEIKARGGPVLAVGTEGDRELEELADDFIPIPETSEPFSPFLTVVPLQLLAYHVARERGCEIDQPRNLAKSVTVE